MLAPDNKNIQAKKTIWEELNDAGLPKIARLAFIAIGVYLVCLIVAICATGIQNVGQFGDAFGALTSIFNALAFAAVVATVVLQSRELRESREQLVEQATAQKAWAAAAQRQSDAQEKWATAATRTIELTRELESARIRPFIKAEWQRRKGYLEYVVRNVGRGVAILMAVNPRQRESDLGMVLSHEDSQAESQWRTCIIQAIPTHIRVRELELMQFDDLNRAIAPDEPQALVRLIVANGEEEPAFDALRRHFRPVFYFQSSAGEAYDSQTQFSDVQASFRARSASPAAMHGIAQAVLTRGKQE